MNKKNNSKRVVRYSLKDNNTHVVENDSTRALCGHSSDVWNDVELPTNGDQIERLLDTSTCVACTSLLKTESGILPSSSSKKKGKKKDKKKGDDKSSLLKKKSLEDVLHDELLSMGFEYEKDFKREYRFFSERRWRADFAFPELMLLVEVEGGIWGKKINCQKCGSVVKGARSVGRHNRAKGYTEDRNKYNRAQILGWMVISVTTEHLKEASCVVNNRLVTPAAEVVWEAVLSRKKQLENQGE